MEASPQAVEGVLARMGIAMVRPAAGLASLSGAKSRPGMLACVLSGGLPRSGRHQVGTTGSPNVMIPSPASADSLLLRSSVCDAAFSHVQEALSSVRGEEPGPSRDARHDGEATPASVDEV